jgi:hypothetical protein
MLACNLRTSSLRSFLVLDVGTTRARFDFGMAGSLQCKTQRYGRLKAGFSGVDYSIPLCEEELCRGKVQIRNVHSLSAAKISLSAPSLPQSSLSPKRARPSPELRKLKFSFHRQQQYRG